ncbi:MAG: carbamate kinase [Actinomycetota bacterium]|nr:carbamate kinase [Actinomycetota bacterium]
MRVVVALGGNALLERTERPDADIQERHVLRAVDALAPIARDHELVVTHGNGPQVGLLAAESEKDPDLEHPYPFDVLGAQTQGMIGYWLLQALENALPARGVATVLTQTLVDADDPAFADPQKFVGPLYDEDTAKRLSAARGWTVRPDEKGLRRVVASPEPRSIVEIAEVDALLAGGSVVVCAGGGGIPVVRRPDGRLAGVEAVVDKDLTAALLAEHVRADALVILTDVPAVEIDHGTPLARPIGRTTVAELRALPFAPGSMGPKVEAACRFVTATGGLAAIGQLGDAPGLLAGSAGTVVEPVGSAGVGPTGSAGRR